MNPVSVSAAEGGVDKGGTLSPLSTSGGAVAPWRSLSLGPLAPPLLLETNFQGSEHWFAGFVQGTKNHDFVCCSRHALDLCGVQGGREQRFPGGPRLLRVCNERFC